MKARMTYEQNDATNIRPTFVTKEQENLLSSARAGDPAAFESLVMPHRHALLRVTQRILRNREDAEDAVQTAFLHALRHLDAFHGRSRFSSWLTRIAMNAAYMRLRVSPRKRETSLDEAIKGQDAVGRFSLVERRPNPEEEYSANEVHCLLKKAIARLAPLYIQIMHMSDVQQLSAKEAAQILGVPEGTVKARLHRARVRLVHHVRSMLGPRKSQLSRNNDLAHM